MVTSQSTANLGVEQNCKEVASKMWICHLAEFIYSQDNHQCWRLVVAVPNLGRVMSRGQYDVREVKGQQDRSSPVL